MSPILPFDIIAVIIDIVGENNDTDLLKELALVSHSLHQICSKHLFATVELYDLDVNAQNYRAASSKRGFAELLRSRPEVVKYIRKLTYYSCSDISMFQPLSTCSILDDIRPLSSILPNLLRTIPRLNYIKISALSQDWNTMDSSLTSAFLYLMHLPTINHIDLSYIKNFPLSCFTSSPSPNLHRLDIFSLRCSNREDGPLEIVLQSEMMPKIREFHSSASSRLTTELLHAKNQDGRPAFNFMNLRQLDICIEDEQNIRYLLQNTKLLEKLHLEVGNYQRTARLRDILSPLVGALTLKVLDFSVFSLYDYLRLAGLCRGLEVLAGHNMLEALSFEIHVAGYDTENSVGYEVQRVEKVLVKPGWSALRQVSFQLFTHFEGARKFSEELQTLPNKYLSHLSKLESVAFNFSTSVSEYCL